MTSPIATQWIQATLSPFPAARAHFQHYVEGSGSERHIATEEVWADSPLFQHVLRFFIHPVLQRDVPCGSLAIPQFHLCCWNWRLALGSITVDWQRKDDDILLRAHTRYRWAPDEARLTRSLHRRMTQIPSAQSFRIEGSACRVPAALFQFPVDRPRVPRYRRLYL